MCVPDGPRNFYQVGHQSEVGAPIGIFHQWIHQNVNSSRVVLRVCHWLLVSDLSLGSELHTRLGPYPAKVRVTQLMVLVDLPDHRPRWDRSVPPSVRLTQWGGIWVPSCYPSVVSRPPSSTLWSSCPESRCSGFVTPRVWTHVGSPSVIGSSLRCR